MKNKIAHLLASYFGLGYAPKASGTVGSLGTLPAAFAAAYFFGTAGILTAAATAFFIGVWATHEIISHQEEKDPSLVVIDEFAGQMLTFVLPDSSYIIIPTHGWFISSASDFSACSTLLSSDRSNGRTAG